MNYRSLADMNAAIVCGMARLPPALDLVVGVPRSGLLPANLLCLALNVPMADLEGYCAGRVLSTGRTRQRDTVKDRAPRERQVVVVDDSIYSGAAMRSARAAIDAAGLGDEVTFVAVYGNSAGHPDVDLVLEAVPQPRFFQWNVMHHDILQHACVDIDGVLCVDPTDTENDDGTNYDRFLREATPLWRPTRPIGRLVTSRLEKYRPQTEEWLRRQGIDYGQLHMLDLPSRAERLRLGAHGRFKAEVYARGDALLFIESSHDQAVEIATSSGKPVLCACCFEYLRPDRLSLNAMRQSLRTAPRRLQLAHRHELSREELKKTLRGVIGKDAYVFLKWLAGRHRAS